MRAVLWDGSFQMTAAGREEAIGVRLAHADERRPALASERDVPAANGMPRRMPRPAGLSPDAAGSRQTGPWRASPADEVFLLPGKDGALALPAFQLLAVSRPAADGALSDYQLPKSVTAAPSPPSRWSGSAWILLRGGEPSPGRPGGLAGYGGSQAGAVLRYGLVPASRHRPAAYLRLSTAFGPQGGRDRELAAGFALRPLPGVPLALLGEGRLQHAPAGERLRPAVSLVTELPPQTLLFGAEGEVYAQTGYVGGKDATAFFDVQAAVERPVAKVAGLDLRIGGGAWAGGQRGAQRLDIGPRVSARIDLGGPSARLSADWRLRVAGNASPGSGPALTLSAGF